MNNMLNPKLLELLAGVDKNKLAQVSNMVKNMSPDDLSNLARMVGINNQNSSNQNQNNQNSQSN